MLNNLNAKYNSYTLKKKSKSDLILIVLELVNIINSSKEFRSIKDVNKIEKLISDIETLRKNYKKLKREIYESDLIK